MFGSTQHDHAAVERLRLPTHVQDALVEVGVAPCQTCDLAVSEADPSGENDGHPEPLRHLSDQRPHPSRGGRRPLVTGHVLGDAHDS